jgi:diguanylate cyclase (GGDEF)-like protein/PAS domain S-box-containing protein
VREQAPSLILMDINLGPGTDGVNAAHMIRSEVDVPVVFLTAHTDLATLRRAKTTDPFGYVVKPCEDHDLQIAIEMALYRHGVDVGVREKGQWLTATLSSIDDGVIATDARGRIVFMNRVAEMLTGRARADALYHDVASVFTTISEETGQPLPCVAGKALGGDCAIVVSDGTALVGLSGEHRQVEGAASPIRDIYGKLSGAVVAFRDVSARRQLERERDDYRRELEAVNTQLELLATTDQLTGLKNRRVFQTRLAEEIARTQRATPPLSLLMIDVDRFKQFNDTFGHVPGDTVLQQVAQLLQQHARAVDVVARYGGEEFAVLLPETDEAGARAMGERLRQAIATAKWKQRSVTISVGCATFGLVRDSERALVQRADAALYRSKERGRNCVHHATDLQLVA